jgi:hypothetical protein
MPCPTCGGTRSVYFFIHGNFTEAFILNPGAFVLSIIIMFELIRSIYFFIKKTDYKIQVNLLKFYIAFFLVSLIVQWIIKL